MLHIQLTLYLLGIDFGFSYVDNSSQWRFPIAFQILFALLLIAGISILPESPRWLLNQGREEEATNIVAALNGTPADDEATLNEMRFMIKNIRAANGAQEQTSFGDVFSRGKGKHLRRTLIGASSQAFQQLGGCNAVIYCKFYPPLVIRCMIYEN